MPRPLHYIVRPGPTTMLPSGGLSQGPARLVPLIAIDQLPGWLEIAGVPRQLAAREAVDMVAIVGHEVKTGDDGVFEVTIKKGGEAAAVKMEVKKPGEASIETKPLVDVGVDGDVVVDGDLLTNKIVANKTDIKVALPAAKTAPLSVQYTASITPKTPPNKAALVDKRGDVNLESLVSPVSIASNNSDASFKSAKSTKIGKSGKCGKSPKSGKSGKSAKGSKLGKSTPDRDGKTLTPKSPVEASTLDAFSQFLERLNEKPLDQHFLNNDDSGDVVVVVRPANIVDRPPYDFPRRPGSDGNDGSDGVPENLIDFETYQKEGEALKTALKNEPVNYDTPGNRPPGVEKSPTASQTTTPKASQTTSPKSRSPKTSWPAQKPRAAASPAPCRFWCKTGRCVFSPRCRYAHVMPDTTEGWRAVGLEKLPDWFVKAGESTTTTAIRPTDTRVRGRRMSTSPLPPHRHVRSGSPRPAMNNSAMQPSRPSRFWKQTLDQNPNNSLRSSSSDGSMAAHRDKGDGGKGGKNEETEKTKEDTAARVIDYSDIDLVDLS